MTVMAVAFQSITASALERLADNIITPTKSKSERFITASTSTLNELVNWALWPSSDKAIDVPVKKCRN
jgi:hypothetical protein